MFTYKIDDHSYLSLMEIQDAGKLYDLINRNREHVGEWLKFPSMTLKVEDSQAFIERTRISYAKEEGYWLGIWNEDQLVGSIGYLYVDNENKKTEIGYWLVNRLNLVGQKKIRDCRMELLC